MPNSIRKVTIVANKVLTPKIRLIRFRFEDNHPIQFIPGQFISVHLDDPNNSKKPIKRSYSIASMHFDKEQNHHIDIVLTILPDGIASQFFAHAKEGFKINLSGPYGALTLPEDLPRRLFLVATSTGVAPYRSMLPALSLLMENRDDLDVELILGVQTKEESLFAEDFRNFQSNHHHFQFNLCYSRAVDISLSQDEFSGYVQSRLSALAPNPENSLVYLCGNPQMIDDAYKLLSQRGFSPRQIKREKYIHSKR